MRIARYLQCDVSWLRLHRSVTRHAPRNYRAKAIQCSGFPITDVPLCSWRTKSEKQSQIIVGIYRCPISESFRNGTIRVIITGLQMLHGHQNWFHSTRILTELHWCRIKYAVCWDPWIVTWKYTMRVIKVSIIFRPIARWHRIVPVVVAAAGAWLLLFIK